MIQYLGKEWIIGYNVGCNININTHFNFEDYFNLNRKLKLRKLCFEYNI